MYGTGGDIRGGFGLPRRNPVVAFHLAASDSIGTASLHHTLIQQQPRGDSSCHVFDVAAVVDFSTLAVPGH